MINELESTELSDEKLAIYLSNNTPVDKINQVYKQA